MLEREALQGLLLKSEPTRLAVVRHMADSVFAAFQNLADTSGDSIPDSASASAKQGKLAADLAAVEQTVIASKDQAACNVVWQSLAPVLAQQGTSFNPYGGIPKAVPAMAPRPSKAQQGKTVIVPVEQASQINSPARQLLCVSFSCPL